MSAATILFYKKALLVSVIVISDDGCSGHIIWLHDPCLQVA